MPAWCRDNPQMIASRSNIGGSLAQNHAVLGFRHFQRTKGIQPLGQRFSKIGRHMLHNDYRCREICGNVLKKCFKGPRAAGRAANRNQLV
ncbi:hypothetical protein D3C76_1725890 [compost metagenome]